jgi:uncharacterized protein YegJ (DUF2314 family)
MVVVDVTEPAATSHAVNPVAKVAQKAVEDAQKPSMAAVHAVVVVDAVVAVTAQRKAKVRVRVNASVLTKRVAPWTPVNQP